MTRPPEKKIPPMPDDASAKNTRAAVALFVCASHAALAGDLVSKRLAEFIVDPVGLIPGLLRLSPITINRGAVFGIGQGKVALFVALTLVAIFAIDAVFLKYGLRSRTLATGLGLVLGGACGNLCDRLALRGVRDFIVLYVGSFEWPTFNVADSCICCGAALLMWYSWKNPPE